MTETVEPKAPLGMLWFLGMCSFASMASMRICDAMLPAFAADFSVTTGQAAATVSAFALAYGVLQLFYGSLGDHFGKVRVIAIATLGCTVGNVCAALSSSLDGLVLSRVASGATAAGVIPLAMAWIGVAGPPRRGPEHLLEQQRIARARELLLRAVGEIETMPLPGAAPTRRGVQNQTRTRPEPDQD